MRTRLATIFLCLLVIGASAGLAGCGSGSSSSERTRLIHRLSAQTSNLPADLRGCINQGASGLPISQLRAVANAGSNPTASTKQTAIRLLTDCIRQGKGVQALRSVMLQRIAAVFPSTLPASFRTCVEQQANGISADQLAGLLSTYTTGGQAASEGQARQLGRQLGTQCLKQPAVLVSLRGLFLKPIEAFAQSGHYSQAFRQCVLHKAEHVSDAQLEQFAFNPAGARAAGSQLGAAYAKACIASGARP